jgi:hypothetical protein
MREKGAIAPALEPENANWTKPAARAAHRENPHNARMQPLAPFFWRRLREAKRRPRQRSAYEDEHHPENRASFESVQQHPATTGTSAGAMPKTSVSRDIELCASGPR